MKLSKISLTVSAALIAGIMLGGCGKNIINSEADEINLYSWNYSDKEGISAKLEFEENKALLTIESSGESCKIQGLCVFGDNSFVIVDNNLQKEFLFNYTLSGKYLETEYNGNKIRFNKSDPENQGNR